MRSKDCPSISISDSLPPLCPNPISQPRNPSKSPSKQEKPIFSAPAGSLPTSLSATVPTRERTFLRRSSRRKKTAMPFSVSANEPETPPSATDRTPGCSGRPTAITSRLSFLQLFYRRFKSTATLPEFSERKADGFRSGGFVSIHFLESHPDQRIDRKFDR